MADISTGRFGLDYRPSSGVGGLDAPATLQAYVAYGPVGKNGWRYITTEARSIAEFEGEIRQAKADLDHLLEEARERWGR